MEISRKKISDEEIYEREKKLAEEATKISEDFKEKFSSIGYELETEFSRENENLTEEKNSAIFRKNHCFFAIYSCICFLDMIKCFKRR